MATAYLCDEREASLDSSATIKRSSQKRPYSEDVDSGDSNESEESIASDISIPGETNYWEANTLDVVRITVEKTKLYKPIAIIKKMLENLPLMASKRVASIEIVDKRVKEIMKCLNEFKPFQRLDFDNIIQIRDKEDSNYQLFTRQSTGCSEWTVKIPSNPIKSEEHWYHMFINYADEFAEDLKYTISRYQNDKKITESMYGVLFKDFIGMFGVHCVATPCVPKRSMSIGKVEVSSVPAMLLMDQLNIVKDTPGAFTMDILALVEMKNEFKEPENHSSLNLGSKSRKSDPEEQNVHKDFSINDKLIGQHVGELLVHYPISSCRKQGLLGIIVEKTHVTFSYLSCTEEQFEMIKNGKCSPYGHRPKAIFSKSYNYLKSSDREELMESMLILGLLQRI